MCHYCYQRNRNKGYLQQRYEKGRLTTPKRKKIPQNGLKRVFKPTGRMKFYKEIWEERPHVSEVDNKSTLLPYGHPKWHWQFSHILPHGGGYKHFEFEKRNILLKTCEQHNMWGNHIHKIVDREGNVLLPQWEKVVKLRDELKAEYNQRFNNQK